MARNDEFSKVLMEALVETLSAHDTQPGCGAGQHAPSSKSGALRIDIQGVTINRLVVEVPRE